MATYQNSSKEAAKSKSWAEYKSHTFVKLKANAKAQSLDLALRQIAQKTNQNIVFTKKKNEFRKQALADISPGTEELRYNPYVESWSDIYINFSIPLMILLLAGFNYTNLTLARSLSRSREVGVRKVMGAVRRQLILQFICEALIISFLAFFIGIVILALMKQTIHVPWLVWEVDNQTIIWVLFIVFTLLARSCCGKPTSLDFIKFPAR
jgi:putative ABC transport system permease protein